MKLNDILLYHTHVVIVIGHGLGGDVADVFVFVHCQHQTVFGARGMAVQFGAGSVVPRLRSSTTKPALVSVKAVPLIRQVLPWR